MQGNEPQDNVGSKIGSINWITDYPEKPDEWGTVVVEIQSSAIPEKYSLPLVKLKKALCELADE